MPTPLTAFENFSLTAHTTSYLYGLNQSSYSKAFAAKVISVPAILFASVVDVGAHTTGCGLKLVGGTLALPWNIVVTPFSNTLPTARSSGFSSALIHLHRVIEGLFTAAILPFIYLISAEGAYHFVLPRLEKLAAQRIAELDGQVSTLTTELAAQKRDLDQKTRELEEAQNDLNTLANPPNLSNLQAEIRALKQKEERTTRDLQTANDEFVNLKAAKDDREQKANLLEQENQELAQQVNELQASLSQALSQVQPEGSVANQAETIRQLNDQIQQKNSELLALQQSHQANINSATADLQRQLQDLLTQLRDEQSRAAEEKQRLEAEIAQKQTQIDTLNEQVTNLQGEVQTLTIANQQINGGLIALRAELTAHQGTIASKQQQLDDSIQQLEEKQRLLDTLEKEKSALAQQIALITNPKQVPQEILDLNQRIDGLNSALVDETKNVELLRKQLEEQSQKLAAKEAAYEKLNQARLGLETIIQQKEEELSEQIKSTQQQQQMLQAEIAQLKQEVTAKKNVELNSTEHSEDEKPSADDSSSASPAIPPSPPPLPSSSSSPTRKADSPNHNGATRPETSTSETDLQDPNSEPQKLLLAAIRDFKKKGSLKKTETVVQDNQLPTQKEEADESSQQSNGGWGITDYLSGLIQHVVGSSNAESRDLAPKPTTDGTSSPVNGGLSDGQGVEVREYIAPVSQRPTSDASSMNTGYYKKYGKKPVIDPSKKVRGHERETSDMQERAEAHKKRFETATEDLLTAIRSYKLSRSGESSQAPSIGSAFIGFKDTLDLIRERKSFSLRPKHAALLKSENAVEIGRYMQQVQNILNQLEEDEDLNPKTADISVSVCKDATQNDVPHLITYFEELQKQLRLRKQDLTPKVDEEALQAQQAAELVLHEQNLAEIAKQKFEEQKAKDLADIAFTKHGLPDHDIVDIFNSLTITCRFGVNNLFDQVNKEFAASENHITFKDQDDFKAQYTHAYTTLQSVVSWDELTKEENRRLIRSVRGMVKALKKVVKFK